MNGVTTLFASDEQQGSISIEHEQLLTALRSGKAIMPRSSGDGQRNSRFWKASPASLSKAIHHANILEKLEKGHPLTLEEQYSPSTLRRWSRAVREGLTAGLSPVEALLGYESEKGFRGPHIDSQLSAEVNAQIVAALNDKKNKTTISNYFAVKKIVEASGHVDVAPV